jgi:hypothetical protein
MAIVDMAKVIRRNRLQIGFVNYSRRNQQNAPVPNAERFLQRTGALFRRMGSHKPDVCTRLTSSGPLLPHSRRLLGFDRKRLAVFRPYVWPSLWSLQFQRY